jgi:hypothetical protein
MMRPRTNAADAIDATPGSEQPSSSTGESNATTEATPTKHKSARKSHRSRKRTEENAIANKDIIDKLIEVEERLNEHAISNNDRNDKQIEIVAKLNEHSLLLVYIIFLAAVLYFAWALHEMGYFGNKYTPTKCS